MTIKQVISVWLSHHMTLTHLSCSYPISVFTVGPSEEETKTMLSTIGFDSFDALVKSTVPPNIQAPRKLTLEPPRTESEALSRIHRICPEKHCQQVVYWSRILRYASATRHFTKHVGKSRLVYRVYSLSSGNCARTIGNVAQFSNPRRGLDGIAHGRCFPTG